MKRRIENKRDQQGPFRVDQSRFQQIDSQRGAVRFLPFDDGEARVMSIPCTEFFLTGLGVNGRVDLGVVALRCGDVSVHEEMDAAKLRKVAGILIEMAVTIEAQT